MYPTEEQITNYLRRLEIRGEELVRDREKAQEVLESCGIVDKDGSLTGHYR